MNQPLRIMVTAEQKATIDRAAKDGGASNTSEWARTVLLRAAGEQLGETGPKKSRRSGGRED